MHPATSASNDNIAPSLQNVAKKASRFENDTLNPISFIIGVSGLRAILSPLNNGLIFAQSLLTGAPTAAATATAYTPHGGTDGGACRAVIDNNTDYSGGDILVSGKLHPYASNSSADCCQQCSANQECWHWSWIGPLEPQKQYQNLCYLKRVLNQKSKRHGHVSGK